MSDKRDAELDRLRKENSELRSLAWKLGRLTTGPTAAKRGEWINLVLALAERAREILKGENS